MSKLYLIRENPPGAKGVKYACCCKFTR